MSSRIRVRRILRPQSTVLEISGPVAHITLKIVTRLSARQRRTMAIAFLRQMTPLLRYFIWGTLRHSGSFWSDQARAEQRGVRTFRSAGWDSRPGEMGYRIRMRRLEMGCSQSSLSRIVSISDQEISRIERGLVRPREHTLYKLEKVLGIPLIVFAASNVENVEIAKGEVLDERTEDERARAILPEAG